MAYLITTDHLKKIAGIETKLMPELVSWINHFCPAYEIDTPQEYAHFLAQACHESDHFKTTEEYASGKGYEGRTDLGNTKPGDGVRYKGRGLFQNTGKFEYVRLGTIKGLPDIFTDNPELLELPENAVWAACEYWKSRNFSDIANHADTDILNKKYKGKILQLHPVDYISITVNGGYNGYDERRVFYERAKKVLV